jgi:hypothetical protein
MAGALERPALRALARLVDLPVRVGAVARHARGRPEAFVEQLESLIAGASRGSIADSDALLACALWCLEQSDARLAELHAVAVRDGRALVAAILADDAPHRGLARGGRLPPLDIPRTARVVRQLFTQGDTRYLIDGLPYESCAWLEPPPAPLPKLETTAEYKSYFENLFVDYVPSPYKWRPLHPASVQGAVKRLARHHSAFTIGRLLDEPFVREREVISIAARRPTTPAIVRELTSRPRWIQLPSVRAALVANPCTPTRVALLLAVTCLPRLRGIAAAGNVHPRVRELARLVRAPFQ